MKCAGEAEVVQQKCFIPVKVTPISKSKTIQKTRIKPIPGENRPPKCGSVAHQGGYLLSGIVTGKKRV